MNSESLNAKSIVNRLLDYEKPENQNFDGYEIALADFHSMFQRCPVTLMIEIIRAAANDPRVK